MKLSFESDLRYQEEAIKSITDLVQNKKPERVYSLIKRGTSLSEENSILDINHKTNFALIT